MLAGGGRGRRVVFAVGYVRQRLFFFCPGPEPPVSRVVGCELARVSLSHHTAEDERVPIIQDGVVRGFVSLVLLPRDAGGHEGQQREVDLVGVVRVLVG